MYNVILIQLLYLSITLFPSRYYIGFYADNKHLFNNTGLHLYTFSGLLPYEAFRRQSFINSSWQLQTVSDILPVLPSAVLHTSHCPHLCSNQSSEAVLPPSRS